jgi:SAM-dependent methyltransferase
MDAIQAFKAMQRAGWAHFVPLEVWTTPPAANLVRFAGVAGGQKVLDVACGTGVVAVTAARLGARVTGLDITPELLERARENARMAGVSIEFHEGDVEELPFAPGEFDVVLSQYGHMFAPRPDVTIAEMLRVLRPGGTIAFSTWPPESALGRIFTLIAGQLPPPPPGATPPPLWGDPTIVRQRLGSTVKDIVFDRGVLRAPALSPQHHRDMTERTAGPVLKLVELLSVGNPAKLAAFRREYEEIAAEYLRDNVVHQDYLMTRANKV